MSSQAVSPVSICGIRTSQVGGRHVCRGGRFRADFARVTER
jgi:hypothetical protein